MSALSWDEWGERLEQARRAKSRAGSRALADMHARHGAGPGLTTCGRCAHLVMANRDTARGGYPKCALYGSTHGRGTDWRPTWPACGAYRPPPPPPWERREVGERWYRYFRGGELVGAVRYMSRYGRRLPAGAGGFDVGYVDFVRVWLLKLPDVAGDPIMFGSLKKAEECLTEHLAEHARATDATEDPGGAP